MTTDTDSLTVVPTFSRSAVYPIVWTGLFVASTLVVLGFVSLLPGIERVFDLLSISAETAVFVAGTLLVSGALIALAPHVATVVEQSLVGPDDTVADATVSSKTGFLFGGLVLAYWGLTPLVSEFVPDAVGWLYHGGFVIALGGLGGYTLWRGWAVLVALAPSLPELPPLASPTSTTAGTQNPSDVSSADDRPLTDAERVQRLLESREGRMRQADIVDEVEWSASKTSRVIGEMADEGTIEKLRLGRENLIEIADDESS